LSKLWEKEQDLLAKYGNEQNLEYAWIQPVIEGLGWKLVYQTHLQQREPDYALFLSDTEREAAVKAGHKSADFWTLAACQYLAEKIAINPYPPPGRTPARPTTPCPTGSG